MFKDDLLKYITDNRMVKLDYKALEQRFGQSYSNVRSTLNRLEHQGVITKITLIMDSKLVDQSLLEQLIAKNKPSFFQRLRHFFRK